MQKNIEASLSRLKNRLSNEIVEPAWGWGFRVAISVLLPAILSIYFKNHDYFWMIIAAETVSIIELKGSAGLRTRLLVAAIVFSLLFTIIGTSVATMPILAVFLMFPVALCTGLMKNLGDWGLALALNIYLFYLIGSHQPVENWEALAHRLIYVAFGGLWAMLVGVFSFSFLPQSKPYRRTIGNIWQAVNQLIVLVERNWDRKEKKSSIRAVYLLEKNIRKAINESLALFNNLYDGSKSENKDQQLSYLRKCSSLASLQIINVAEIIEDLQKENLDPLYRTQIQSILKVLEQIAARMSYYFYTLKEEEFLLIRSRLNRLQQFQIQLAEMPDNELVLSKKLHLHINRFVRLVEASLNILANNKEERMYQQYSLMQTLTILHPKHLVVNLKQFVNFDNLTLKYALRMAVAAMVSYALGVWLFPDHSYWMPLSTIIVTQPFFGATLKRGIERSVGTVAGVIVGGLLLMLPYELFIKYALLFVGAVMMMYNLRKNYAWAAFFITLFLLGLMSNGEPVAFSLIYERVFATILGSLISIISGFLLFPAWDKKLLPKYLTEAITSNYNYFRHICYDDINAQTQKWANFKIAAESSNSNAFDSLNRYIAEPKYREKNRVPAYFAVITYNIRITREMNSFQDDFEANDSLESNKNISKASIIPLINNIHNTFYKTIQLLEKRYDLDMHIDWQVEKNIKSSLEISLNQRECLERLYLELKALYAGLLH